MKAFKYVIKDKLGIHARPAGMLVKETGRFESIIKIKKGIQEIDAKRLLGVMSLGVKCDDEIEISAEGTDEKEAIEALENFVKQHL